MVYPYVLFGVGIDDGVRVWVGLGEGPNFQFSRGP